MKPMMMVVMAIIVIASIVYAVQGINMHNQVDVEEDKFHALQDEYFSVQKAEREKALTDSELTQKLVEIENYPSTLLKLKLIGIGKILTGIFILLFGILIALVMMPMRLGMIIKGKK